MKKFPIVVQPELVEHFGSMSRAAIYGLIVYWTHFNKNSNKNFYDGRHWTYMTITKFCEYTGLSDRQVRRQLKNLEDEGYIISGNYNKIAFDRTKWYSPSDRTIPFHTTEGSIPLGQDDRMDEDKMTASEADIMSSPIPERKDENKEIESKSLSHSSQFNTLMNLFGEDPQYFSANKREWDKLTNAEKEQAVLKAEEYVKFDKRQNKSLRFYFIDRKWELDLTPPTENNKFTETQWEN